MSGAFVWSEARAVLERTPRALDAMLRDLPAAWCDATEGEGTWSPHTVVEHLLHAEHTDWMVRVRIILAQGADPRFTPFDREGGARAARLPLNELLDAFAAERAAGLAELATHRLDADTLALTGIHPEFGRVTLAQLLATWTAHDLSHLTQISRTMAKHYRDAVGPWTAYLSVMRR